MIRGPAPCQTTAILRAAAGLAVAAFPILWALDPAGTVTQALVVEQFLVAELVAALLVVFLAPGRGWLGLATSGVALVLGLALFPELRHFVPDLSPAG